VYSQIFKKTDLTKELFALSEQILFALDRVEDSLLVRVSDKLTLVTKFQFLWNLKPQSQVQKTLLEHMTRYALMSEKNFPGTFDTVIRNIAENCHSCDGGNHNLNLENFSDIWSRPPQLKDIDRLVFQELDQKDPLISSLLRRSLSLAGFGGKITLEKTESKTNSIELVSGYSFDVNPLWSQNVRLKSPKVICVDGYIESVSQIHHVLESFGQSKESALLFVRGMSDDVLHTLKVNWERGSLKIFPILVKFDLEGINMMADIAIVSGGDVISSLKGDLISSVKIDELPTIEEANIVGGKVSIQNKRTTKRVTQHLTHLREKRSEKSGVEDYERLIDKRIKSLISGQVVVRIVDDKDFVRRSQLFDFSLRKISSIISNGIPEGDFLPHHFFSSLFFSNISEVGSLIINVPCLQES
jgi:hypothetical protein